MANRVFFTFHYKDVIGVLGCLGNHEYMTKTEESITHLLAREQIRILRQDRAPIELNGESLNIIGIDYEQGRFSTDHEGHLVDRYLEGKEKLVLPGMVNILLNHNPNAFDRAAELGVDLMLTGPHSRRAAIAGIASSRSLPQPIRNTLRQRMVRKSRYAALCQPRHRHH
jgi:predicted MPP superfamily phosphohydrolase